MASANPLDEGFSRCGSIDAASKAASRSASTRLVMLAAGAHRIDQVVWTKPAGEG